MELRSRFAVVFALIASLVIMGASQAHGQDIRITEGPSNNPAQYIGRAAVDYPMLQVGLENRTSELLELHALTVRATGTGHDVNALNATGVALLNDANGNGIRDTDEVLLGAGAFSGDDGSLTIAIAPALPLPAGQTTQVVILYNLNEKASATAGQTFRVQVENASAVDIRRPGGAPVTFQPNAFPVLGILKTVGQGFLQVTVEPDSVQNNIIPYFLAGFPRTEGMRLRIENSLDERVAVRQMTLTVAGTANDALIFAPNGIEYVPLEKVDTGLTAALPAVAAGTISGNNGQATLVFNPPIQLSRGQVSYAAIATTTAVAAGEYFKDASFSIAQGSIVAEGLDSLVPSLAVLGEGLTGPLRQYHGHTNSLSINSDPGASPVTPGSSNYSAMAFTIRNGDYEAVTLQSLTIRALGSANEPVHIGAVRLWRDATNNGQVVPDADEQIDQPKVFTENNGTLTFDLAGRQLAARGSLRLIVGVDLPTSVPPGVTLQFAIQNVNSIVATGVTTQAPTVTTNVPLNSSVRTVTPYEVTLYEMDASPDSRERRELPRRSVNSVVLWNFELTTTQAEDLLLESLSVKLGGSVNHPQFIQEIQLYHDTNNNGWINDSDADVLLSRAGVGERNQTVILDASEAPGFRLVRNRRYSFHVSAILNGPLSLYGETLQLEIPDGGLRLIGALSNQPAAVNTPFISVEKTIVQPSVTLIPGPWFSQGETASFTCINNGGAPMINFYLKAGDSEGAVWQNIVINGNSSRGADGLADWVRTPWFFLDRNNDALFNGSDLVVVSPQFSVYPFVGLQSIMNVAEGLGLISGFYTSSLLNEINPARTLQMNYTIPYQLNSPVAVAVDGSVFVEATVPVGGLQLIGSESGDPVVVVDEVAMNGRLNMTRGTVNISNISTALDKYADSINPFCPNPDASCDKWVLAMQIATTTDAIEPINLSTLAFNIEVNSPLPLNQIISAARLTHKKALGYAEIAPLQIDFQNNRLTLRPEDIVGQNVFYSFWASPTPDAFVVHLEVLPSAVGSIQVTMAGANDLVFQGDCSLVPPGGIIQNFNGEFPYLGRPLVFTPKVSNLDISLERVNEDFPYVPFPGNQSNYAVMRARIRQDLKDERLRITRMVFNASGDAHDVDALKATDVVVEGATPANALEWTVSGGAARTLARVAGSGAANGSGRLTLGGTLSGAPPAGSAVIDALYRPLPGTINPTGAANLAVQVLNAGPGIPDLFLRLHESDGDVWQTKTAFVPTGLWAPWAVPLNQSDFNLVQGASGSFNPASIQLIGFRAQSATAGDISVNFDDLRWDLGSNNSRMISDFEAAVELVYVNAVVGSGRFSADDGQIVFENLNILVDTTNRNLQIRFNPGEQSRTFQNIGQQIQLSIPPGGISGVGELTSTPLGEVRCFQQQTGNTATPLPFTPPPIRIGAGRIFVEIQQVNAFPVFHVSEISNVVTVAFSLGTDRAENVLLEEILVTATGTMNDLTAIDGSAVRLHANIAPNNEFTPGPTADRQLGVGVFEVDDGVARIRFPAIPLNLSSKTQYILAVDLTGVAEDFETFRHSFIGPEAIRARGVLSNDYAFPWYGGANTGTPNTPNFDGPLNTIGRATLDMNRTTLLAANTPDNPVYVLPGTSNIPLLSLEFEALPIEDMLANGFVFRTRGSGDESTGVSRAFVVRDENKDGRADTAEVLLGQGVFTEDDQELTLPFIQPINILRKQKDTWLVSYDLASDVPVGSAFQAYLDLPNQTLTTVLGIVLGKGLFSNQDIGVLRTISGNNPFEGPWIQVSPGILDVRRGANNPGQRDVLLTAQNVPLLQWRANEVFGLEDAGMLTLTVDVASNNSANLQQALANTVFALYREDGACVNGRVDCNDRLLATAGFVVGTANTLGTLTFDFSTMGDVVAASAQGTYLITAQTINAPPEAVGAQLTLTISSPGSLSALGLTSLLPNVFRLPSGAVVSSRFTLNTSTIRLQRDSRTPDGSDAIAPDALNETLLAFTARPSNGSDVRFDQLLIQQAGTINSVTGFVPGSIRLVYDSGGTSGILDAGDRVLASGSFGADGNLLFSTIDQMIIPANATYRFIVVGNMSGTGTAGQTVVVRIPNVPSPFIYTAVPDEQPSVPVQTSLPIAGGPTPLVARTLVASVHPSQLANLGTVPAGTDRTLAHFNLAISLATDQTLTRVRVGLEGTAAIPGVFTEGVVRLYQDKIANGRVDAQDFLVGTAPIIDGAADFTGLSLRITKNRTEPFIAVASFNGTAELDSNVRASITNVEASSFYQQQPAAVSGLPLAGTLVTFTEPSIRPRNMRSESVPWALHLERQNVVLQGLALDVSLADEAILDRIVFEIVEPQTIPDDFFGQDAFRLVLDGNRTGRVETTGDQLLGASALQYTGSSIIEFTGLNLTLARGRVHYLLLRGNLGTAATAGSVVQVRVVDFNARAATSGGPLGISSLPIVGATRTLAAPEVLQSSPFVNGFEEADTRWRPALDWGRIVDATRAREGSAFMSAQRLEDYAGVNGSYELLLVPGVNMAALPGTAKSLSFWVRHSFPTTSWRARVQVSTNNGGSWSTRTTINGESRHWALTTHTFTTTQNVAENLMIRILFDNGSVSAPNPAAFFEVDRVILQATPPSIDPRNFTVNGGDTLLRPLQRTANVTFTLRNLAGAGRPLDINEIGFRLQDANGRNLNSYITGVQQVAGVAQLTPSATTPFEYQVTFAGDLPVGKVRLGAYALYQDSPTPLAFPYINDSLGSIELTVADPNDPAFAIAGWIVR